MDFALTDDQLAYQKMARQFAQKELKPNAAEWDRNSHFPIDVIKKTGELGFLGLYTNPDYDGLGLPRLDSAIVFEELAWGDTAVAAYISIHNMVAWMIGEFATDEVRSDIVPKLVSGEYLGSYCLTEPNAGSDAGSLTTKAIKQDGEDYYLLNGEKTFISGAGSTDILVVMARTGGAGPKGVSALVVDAHSDGISYGKNEHKMGWKAQPTRTIHFKDVKVPAKNLLGNEGEGFKFAMKGLDGGRINIGVCAVGTAQAALETALAYVQERKQFGSAIAELQSVQFKLADMLTQTVAARQMLYLAASKVDANDPNATTYCAMAKRLSTDLSFDVANQALQLHGGYGYLNEYPLERHVRDLRVHQILEGTNEIMRVIVSRKMMSDHALDSLR
ncbi:acyl-CoA dehydrogenase family protein [Psychrobacter sp. FDAARGOS_221]|uniref:acyl-CoA dehydrogenase family protein n=1 Tax=Psychrobacter sp. FDAARGOS_221 TaxID=1975705 RepID=UPI000BB58983|nr:acyl-CoA dehydrogenase family protein [Psychrobacter sp. FDAARGOS_221]PNK60450.1 acyl-CoA dehydrogenase [Psychrobacter sp. FDAARGOS_221]